MRFEPGKKVVCINKNSWPLGFGPDFNEIVTVQHYGIFKLPFNPHTHWLAFEEYQELDQSDGLRIGYAAKYFRPIADISELTAILESEPQTQSV